MKRFLAIATVLGTLSLVAVAEAGHPRRVHRHRDFRCSPPAVAYRVPVYRPRAVYVEPRVVYPRFYGPTNNFSFYGRNFGLQFGW